MAPMESVKHVWSSWGLHVLVIFSFSLQVVLLVLGDFRRRMNSGVLRAVAWSAYLLADSTAIYVLGHLSVMSRSPEHQLMVLWAPFLLLHLGGQDNITAYAIEDTRLWMRHLQALVVQGIAAAYVVYESSIVGSRLFLGRATIIMFIVGLLKYAERVWALMCAGATSSGKGNTYRPIRGKVEQDGSRRLLKVVESLMNLGPLRLEAHGLLDVPRDFLNGPLPYISVGRGARALRMSMGHLYSVVEIQLSLMHDIFYTKTGLIHGWHGILARTIWTASTAVALSLFHTDDKDGYNRVDVVVTYVLFTGALILETMWLLRSMFSSWTMVPLENHMGTHPLDMVKNLLEFFRKQQKLLGFQDWRRRYWHRCMEQHDLLVLCSGNRASRRSHLAARFHVEDWWNMRAYSWSIPIPRSVEKLVADHVDRSKRLPEASKDHIFNTRGQMALHTWGLYDRLRWSIDIELDESILVWHIATKIWLCRNRRDLDDQAKDLEKAVEALSNYMMFLLAGRSYMLPPPANRAAYVELCYYLTNPCMAYRSPGELASLLLSNGEALNDEPEDKGTMDCLFGNKILQNGSKLGATLISHHNNVEQGTPPTYIVSLLAQVWAEMLCYAGHRCSGFYHVKQLSNGGELITVAAILGHYVSNVVDEDKEALVKDGQATDATTPVSLTSANEVSHASEGV